MVYNSAISAKSIRPKSTTVRTWMMARMMEMFFVVRRTL